MSSDVDCLWQRALLLSDTQIVCCVQPHSGLHKYARSTSESRLITLLNLFREMSRIDITTVIISRRFYSYEIYCHISDQDLHHYLNLHGDNQAFSDHPTMMGSRSASYVMRSQTSANNICMVRTVHPDLVSQKTLAFYGKTSNECHNKIVVKHPLNHR